MSIGFEASMRRALELLRIWISSAPDTEETLPEPGRREMRRERRPAAVVDALTVPDNGLYAVGSEAGCSFSVD